MQALQVCFGHVIHSTTRCYVIPTQKIATTVGAVNAKYNVKYFVKCTAAIFFQLYQTNMRKSSPVESDVCVGMTICAIKREEKSQVNSA